MLTIYQMCIVLQSCLLALACYTASPGWSCLVISLCTSRSESQVDSKAPCSFSLEMFARRVFDTLCHLTNELRQANLPREHI